MFTTDASWCQAEPQHPDNNTEVTREKNDSRVGTRSESSLHQASPHSQKVIQKKSSASSEAHSHQIQVEPIKQDPNIDEILDRHAVQLIDERIPYGDPASLATPSKPAKRTLTDIEKAWQFFRQGNYAAAESIFFSLLSSSNRKQALNARLGLAYTQLKQSKKNLARLHLRQLVEQKYQLTEILPIYMQLVLETGDYKTAQRYLPQLPPKHRAYWEQRILESQVTADFKTLPKIPDSRQLSNFVLRNEVALSRCILPHIFFEIAQMLHNVQEDALSLDINKQLLSCKLPHGLHHGILSLLTDLISETEALALVQNEKHTYALSEPGYLQKLDQLELQILRRRLKSLPLKSPERAETAEAILTYRSDDPDALAALAWHKFNINDYRGAAEIFSRLLELEPDNKSYALGLGYSRLNLGEYDTALIPLQQANIPDDSETLALKKSVYQQQANQAYEDQNWSVAAGHLETVLEVDPDDIAAKQLLAWTRYRQDRNTDARSLMQEIYKKTKNPETAGWLLDIYAGMDDEKSAFELAKDLSQEETPGMRSVAADFFFDHDAPITASQTFNDPEKCYFNASVPRVDAFSYYKFRDGDEGFTTLKQIALPITAAFPAEIGKQWSLTVTPKYLSSGDAPDEPFAGSFYNFLNGTPQLNDLEDELFVWQPDVGFENEGRISTSIHVGSTPFNGIVSPTPTFNLTVGTSKWYLDVHRLNVKDTILSYTGLRDPYSSSEWGRVTRNGVSGGYNWTFLSDYWLSTNLGYNFYNGHHLWDNDSYHLDTAIGRTYTLNRDELAVGLFFTAQHYRRNSDFFTFGHGGYYSPDLMTMVGPLLRYRSDLCKDYWFDFQAVVGWLHQDFDSSPFYPLLDGNASGLNPAAAANASGEYDSRTKDELGFSFKLQGMKLLNRRLAAGGFAGLQRNTEFTEWQVGAGISYFFDLQNLFWKRTDFFHEFGSWSNK
ncbi:MAG: cellulose synthase subunit BcsC-related outer membrane protein [Desulfobacterales bacterium]|jgi:Flp pilus assembly protein TadD